MHWQLLRWNMCFVLKEDCCALSLHRSSSRQRAARLSSAVWNTYSVTFFSGCAEGEIWALWTCLLVENRFLCRPVKLHLLETWLTIRGSASVLVSVRNQLRYVSPVGRWVVYVYAQVCVCANVCWEVWLLKLPLCLGRCFHRDFNVEEDRRRESTFNVHSMRKQSWLKPPAELLIGLDKQRALVFCHAQILTNKPRCTPSIQWDHCGVAKFKGC